MIGQTIGGKYAIVRRLGEGGMGAVYEARHTGTGRRVAVKVITGELARDPKLVARFEIEARAAGAIDSEHIAQVLDVGRDDASGAPFLAMEYLEGEDLQELLGRLGPVAPDLALRIGVQACLGLEKAHAQGIVHRDIKPANLFLTVRDGGELRVKVLDFGIAKVSARDAGPQEPPRERQAPLTRMGMLLGSPLYMSPEQARGKGEIDARTDIWSLGIVLYQALTGRTPFDHVTSVGDFVMAVCSVPVTPIHTYAPWVAPAIAAAVERALRTDPAERYQSATEMREALSAFLPQGASIRSTTLVPASKAGIAIASPVTIAATPMGASGTGGTGGTAVNRGASAASLAPSLRDVNPTAPTMSATPIGAATPIVVLTPPVGAAPMIATPPPRAPAQGPSVLTIAAVVAALSAGALGVAFGMGWIGRKRPPRAVSIAVASAEPTASPSTLPPALAALLGPWFGDGGQAYDAVAINGGVSFRLRDPDHLAAQGYVAGDPHFVVRASEGEPGGFRVEARARPLPPKGLLYDIARAHATCVAPWVDLAGVPLHAQLDGERLLVRLARLDATAAMFKREGPHVIGCSGLGDATASELDVVLSRDATPAPPPTTARWPIADAGAHDAGGVGDAGAHDAGVHDAHDAGPPVDPGPPDPGPGHLLPVGAPCQIDAQCRSRTCVAARCLRPGARPLRQMHGG